MREKEEQKVPPRTIISEGRGLAARIHDDYGPSETAVYNFDVADLDYESIQSYQLHPPTSYYLCCCCRAYCETASK